MKILTSVLLLSIFTISNVYSQNNKIMVNKISTNIPSKQHSSSSILLWMRTDKPRQAGMDRWKGPHSQIIAANKGLLEYRQIHFLENNAGLWQPINGVETEIPVDRKIDGVADVTLKNIFSAFRGKEQNKLAFKDEVNIFKRTIMYVSLLGASQWYNVNSTNEKINSRSMVFFRIKEGVSEKEFKNFINEELTPTLANMGVLKELRRKIYMPWKQSQWDTPNVLHDNAEEVQFQASLILGFTDKNAMEQFFGSDDIKKMSGRLSQFCSAVHAYEMEQTLTYIKDGKRLSEYQK